MRVKELCTFIKERDHIRAVKANGYPRAKWTKDPILAKYRFCNVHREDDAVTKWIAENWREPHKDEPHLWFAMVIARLFNKPSTLAEIGFPLPYKPEQLRKKLHAIKARGDTVFNGAYIVSTNGHAMDKIDYLILHVLGPLWADRDKVGESLKAWGKLVPTLNEFHYTLTKFDGLGSFMAAQAVADMKYVEPLRSAPDWETFAAPGPGSKRGLNRVMLRGKDEPWKGKSWELQLGLLQDAVNARLATVGIRLHAQDLQNCLCEFDKYERARLGEGTPKQIYKEKV